MPGLFRVTFDCAFRQYTMSQAVSEDYTTVSKPYSADSRSLPAPSEDCKGISYSPIIAPMADPTPPRLPERPLSSVSIRQPATDNDKVLCERCGADMYRMHAVWRCPSCGFKTDCCGW